MTISLVLCNSYCLSLPVSVMFRSASLCPSLFVSVSCCPLSAVLSVLTMTMATVQVRGIAAAGGVELVVVEPPRQCGQLFFLSYTVV